MFLRVSSDQKVRQDSGPLSSLLAVRPPRAAREKMRFPRQCLYSDLIGLEECIALSLRLKVNAEFRIDNITNHQRTIACRILERTGRRFVEDLVGYEDVEQDIGVDRCDHRPRTSSMNLSTDE